MHVGRCKFARYHVSASSTCGSNWAPAHRRSPPAPRRPASAARNDVRAGARFHTLAMVVLLGTPRWLDAPAGVLSGAAKRHVCGVRGLSVPKTGLSRGSRQRHVARPVAAVALPIRRTVDVASPGPKPRTHRYHVEHLFGSSSCLLTLSFCPSGQTSLRKSGPS